MILSAYSSLKIVLIVNIVKSSSCYAGVTSPKTKQILGSQRLSPRTWKTQLKKLWDEVNVVGLLYTIQQRLRSDKRGVTIAKISLNFKNLVTKRNVNGALKLLTDNIHSEILPLTLEILELLAQKHLEPKEPSREKLIQGPTRSTDLIAYEDTDESIIMTASILTKGGSKP